jgi:hypothetical protein
LGVADDESLNSHFSRRTAVNNHRLADAGYAVEILVGGHHVAGARGGEQAWNGGKYTFHSSSSDRLTSS